MALVCDISNNQTAPAEEAPAKPGDAEDDLEDGEIEDDDEEVPAEVPPPEELAQPPPMVAVAQGTPNKNADKPDVRTPKERMDRRASRHEEPKEVKGGRKHMTEAEKSILHLRKREKMQREKWEKYRKEQTDSMDDDFAKNIEKTLATILSKKEKLAQSGDDREREDKEEDRRGRKRKKHKDKQKNKQRRTESPKSEDVEDVEMRSPRTEENSENSYTSDEYSSDRSKNEEKGRRKKGGRKNHNRDRNKHRDRERKNESQLKDSQGVCVFYLQGKCLKNDCPYSHEAVPPMKLELCKFYLMDCCAKGDKCSYMHSEFPCKFYHTGLQCNQGENCKFAHGKPLTDGLKQILFKHIETAPRDILGGFPRMSREEALNMINVTQTSLQEKMAPVATETGIPSLLNINVPVPPELMHADEVPPKQAKTEKTGRNRRSRWQEPEPDHKTNFNIKTPFTPFDQDMRINSNGDVDMRTLPPNLTQPPPNMLKQDYSAPIDLEQYKREAGLLPPQVDVNKDVDIRNLDVDIRPPIFAPKDVDIRQMLPVFDDKKSTVESEDENNLHIDTGEEPAEPEPQLPPGLPKTQRDLFMRIQSHQKDVQPVETGNSFDNTMNTDWYSDDESDDENRLTIKVDNDDFKDNNKEEPPKVEPPKVEIPSIIPAGIKPQDVVSKIGDLSKIDISAEVTKLLTSMSQSRNLPSTPKEPDAVPKSRDPRDPRSSSARSPPLSDTKPGESKDPRLANSDPRLAGQRSRQSSTDKTDKVSIYEQGSITGKSGEDSDGDQRGATRSDVDLRNMVLPFKAMQNYTPATEIDASINSHTSIQWKVWIVDIPRPDYTGLKLNVNEAEKSGDPRLRKIFRLSTDEKEIKDSPMSPKESSNKPARIDPRLRKQEEAKTNDQMTFNQQLNMLQNSGFYQNLTSNQKVMLNQELATRNDQNMHDPVLNVLLSNLNLIPTTNLQNNPNLTQALAILASITKLNPLMNQGNPNMMNPNMMPQPGLLGAAPGIPNIPNIPPDFPINFDPRNGGLLGNAPPQFGGNNFPPDNFQQQNFNDDFYPHDNYMGDNNRHPNNNRGFGRDRRRGRSGFNNRNNRNFRNNNRNNNRANRSHTPP